MHIEKTNGEKHVAVIRLYLSAIDHVQVNSRVKEKLGFMPFLGLRKTERYAEVLGHELSHVVWILAHPDLTKLCERHVNADGSLSYKPMDERLVKLESIMGELELRARADELLIWRELHTGRSKASEF